LKDVANGSGSAEDKKKQQDLIQAQIKLLAQLAQLQRQQAEEAQKKQEQNHTKAEGVNKPTDGNQIDIYI
jgi:hypothetical protein